MYYIKYIRNFAILLGVPRVPIDLLVLNGEFDSRHSLIKCMPL